jgi:hypothetical protein
MRALQSIRGKTTTGDGGALPPQFLVVPGFSVQQTPFNRETQHRWLGVEFSGAWLGNVNGRERRKSDVIVGRLDFAFNAVIGIGC